MSVSRAMGGPRPTVAVTVQAPARATNPELARDRNDRYVNALRRAGADVTVLDETAPVHERERVFAEMDGLLLTGGADLDPALYGEEPEPLTVIEQGRDELELEAWRASRRRHVPVLGICRGFQAVNVFSGGRLLQHIEGHALAAYPGAPVKTHPLRLRAGSRLARILRPADPAGGTLHVNSYHHQAVRPGDVAPDLVVAATTRVGRTETVEGLESADADDFVIAVQCHPEREESTPREFGRLWSVFVDACRGSARGDRVG